MSAIMTTTDLKSLLKLALPIGSRLVTGAPSTPVNWVSHLRTRPPFVGENAARELLLVATSALGAAPNPLGLDGVIETLTRTQASALGVQGTLSPRAQQTARAHNFPVIALPDRAALPQIERDIQRLLTNPRAQLLHRAQELQQTLQRHAASYRGLTTMLNALARMLDRPVVIHDRWGHVVSRGLPASHGQEWDSRLALLTGAEFVRRFDPGARGHAGANNSIVEDAAGLTAPLIHEGRLLGYVSVLTAGEASDEFDLLALETCADTLARELVRQQSVERTVEAPRSSRDWIADWLASPASEDALLTLRAGQDSYQPSLWYAVVLFHATPDAARPGAALAPERMVKLLHAELRQRRIQAPLGQHADRAVVLFPLDEPQQTQRLKQMVRLLHDTLCAAAPEGVIGAGVGRPALGLTALRASFQEAERALGLPCQLADETAVAFFGDLSLYELLLGVDSPAMLAEFCQHWLAPLAQYDDQHHTDLLLTLDAYFSNNGNMARTAHVLNIHRNTLVYRLGRITEILQLDMDDSNVRLNLHLALKINRMHKGRVGAAAQDA